MAEYNQYLSAVEEKEKWDGITAEYFTSYLLYGHRGRLQQLSVQMP